jgi:hypothetical protein
VCCPQTCGGLATLRFVAFLPTIWVNSAAEPATADAPKQGGILHGLWGIDSHERAGYGSLQGASRAARFGRLLGGTVRGKIRVLSMLGLSLALLGCGSGNDYGGQTGYDYLPRCQLVVRGPLTDREIVSATYCVGAVSALVGVAPLLPPRYRFCFPDDVTAGEAVQVVVAYLESSLSRLHEDFRPLAIAAMRQAWPCR